MRNPLPRTETTIQRGAAVYAKNCALCHGPNGAGNGPAGQSLSPPPTNLAWLAQTRMGGWDAFVYWTIAEGGAQFGSAMPAFKGSLSTDDIWAIIAYLQAGFPAK
jgi:mono/diheme cytochrome c family protein